MNGGGEGGGGRGEEMEEDERESESRMEEGDLEKTVLMWGYLPGASFRGLPLLHPVPVPMQESAAGDRWRDVNGGGCGFAMALSESGKLYTWGSTDDMGQSYIISGKHEKTPESFPLPTDEPIVKAAAAWAHCVAVTALGDVYTWGWKECVPTGKDIGDQSSAANSENEEKHNGSDQVSTISQVSGSSNGTVTGFESKDGDESKKPRKLSSTKVGHESSTSAEEILSAPPCLVTLGAGIRIATVAAGGRHTLALSDVGQVWGWGYGGEGQLGLGSHVKIVSSPHPIPCIESAAYNKDLPPPNMMGKQNLDTPINKITGSCVKAIACGGRHSAAVTDTGTLLTFGWGLYGQCGQGSTDDELIPTCVSSLQGVKIQGVAAGLWHTVCTSADGAVYSFGGNQFGQLGTGSDQTETLPKRLDDSLLENKNAKIVSCGARHSAMITEEGDIFCWGWNRYGQLGLGDTIDRNSPSLVPLENCSPLNVSCGWWHTLLIADTPP